MNLTALNQASYMPIERIPAIGLGKTLSQANQEFHALSESLQSGDVASAQSSLGDLKKLLQSAGSIGAASAVKNDFASLGKDLGVGDVASAQQDLSRLKGDVQSIAKHGHWMPGMPKRLSGGTALSAVAGVGRLLA